MKVKEPVEDDVGEVSLRMGWCLIRLLRWSSIIVVVKSRNDRRPNKRMRICEDQTEIVEYRTFYPLNETLAGN